MLNYIQTAFLFSIIFVGINVWGMGIWRYRQGRLPIENRLRDASPMGLVDVLLMFASWIVAQSIGIVILQFIGIDAFQMASLSTRDTSILIVVVGLAQLLATLACLAFYWVRYKKMSAIGWQPECSRSDLKTGLIWFFVIIPPVLLIQTLVSIAVPYEHDTLETLKQADSAIPILATWFSAVLVAPVIEEVFFRGVLQNWLQRIGRTDPESFGKLIFGGAHGSDEAQGSGFLSKANQDTGAAAKDENEAVPSNPDEDGNPFRAPTPLQKVLAEPAETGDDGQVYFDSKLRWIPILVTSLMFAASHLGQGAAPVPLFFLSVGLGYLYRQTGSIIPCIAVHFLLNFQTMFWVTMSVVAN
jgi:membrane protease YdiL (CAAX protease family)